MKYLQFIRSTAHKMSKIKFAMAGILAMLLGVCINSSLFNPYFWPTLLISVSLIVGGIYLVIINRSELKEFLEKDGEE